MPRRGPNRAVVALANNNARMACVLLATDHVYTPEPSVAEGCSESTVIRTPATHDARGTTAVMP
jgi:hypothetical protein